MEHTASRLDVHPVHPVLRNRDDLLELASEHAPRGRAPSDLLDHDAAARESATAQGYGARMLLATLCWAVGGGILASAPRPPVMACAVLAVAIGIALAFDARRRLHASLVGRAAAHGVPASRAEAQAEEAIDRLDASSRDRQDREEPAR